MNSTLKLIWQKTFIKKYNVRKNGYALIQERLLDCFKIKMYIYTVKTYHKL